MRIAEPAMTSPYVVTSSARMGHARSSATTSTSPIAATTASSTNRIVARL